MQTGVKGKSNPGQASRSSSGRLLEQNELISSQEFFRDIFGSISGICAVLNRHRQIVFVNNEFLEILGISGIDSILGNRPGEMLSCLHSVNNSGGCGTTDACQFCGAHKAITDSLKTGQKVSCEALITTRKDGRYKSLELKVTSTPVIISGSDFLLLMIEDISSEKRRLALEKIFFHDLMNRASSLHGLLTLIKESNTSGIERKLIDMSEEATNAIIGEIQSHRQIYAAESGDLLVEPVIINSKRIIESVIGKTGLSYSFMNKNINITANTVDIDFETDISILERVLLNLLKNALEATPQGGTVLIGADDLDNRIRFRVKNDQVIPKEIQVQLFQRSFSTKGTGRGLGTYSIRLLTEDYLNGKVSFISNEQEGTVFMIDINKNIQ